jgi:UDP-N-acetylglucosamine:LPS N-acetylglucosamine transferase
MALKLTWIMLRERPDVVISTGAAPGYVAVRLGRVMRAKTVWVDSIANIDHMSMSGEMICGKADMVLTQWPHLAREGAPLYKGSVL